jgi:hypothetical protein
VPVRLAVVALAALALAPPAQADLSYETTVRITDSLGRGTAEFDQVVRTAVTATGRREEVIGSRRVTTRRGKQYGRSGHFVTIERLDESAVYQLDLDAGSYSKTTFAELASERERMLREAEAAFRATPPEVPSAEGVSVTRPDDGAVTVNGLPCSPARLEASRRTALMPARSREADPSPPMRFVMRLDVCLTAEADWSAQANATERRMLDVTGETDEYQARVLDVLARRRDLFAIYDDLHLRLERARRSLAGLPVRWVEEMRGPHRGVADAVLFRFEGTVKTLQVGPVDRSAFAVPPSLTLVDKPRERQQ